MFSRLFANRRPKAARHARRCLSERRLRCEPLEARQLLSVGLYANNTPLAIKDNGTITSTIAVPDSFIVGDLDVKVTIQHARDPDLDVFLIAPDGTRFELFTDVGTTKSKNFTGTVLDDGATTSIALGKAPFTGTFRPEGNLSAVEGKQAQGNWKLEITDDQKQSTGTLNSWSIYVTSAGVPASNFIDTNPTMLGNAGMNAARNNYFSRKIVVSDNGDGMAVWLESKGPADTGPWNAMAAKYVAGSWQTPVVIMDSAPTIYSSTVDLAGDGQGNYLAVMQEGSARVWARRYVADSGWGSADLLGITGGSPLASMAYDPHADVSRAVVSSFGLGGTDDVYINRLDDFASGSWSGNEVAENLPADPGIDQNSIDVAMAQNGDFMLVFNESAVSSLDPTDAYYRVYRQGLGRWEGPETLLENLDAPARTTKVAMNSSGVAMVVWRQKTGPDNISETWARRWNGEGWDTDPQLIVDSGVGTAPSFDSTGRVALSENGEAIVFWGQQRDGSAFSNAYVRHHDGTQWAPEIIQLDTEDLGSVGAGPAANLNGSRMNIAMDDNGNAAAVWAQSDGFYVNMWASQFDGASWSTAEKLENAALDAVMPSVDMSAGVAQVIWTQSDGSLNHMYAATLSGTWKLEVTDDTKKETGKLNSWSLSFTEATVTSTAFLDTNPAMQGNVRSPSGQTSNDVATSENGDAMALWLESKGPGDTGPFMAMAAPYDAATGKWGTPAIVSNPSSTNSVQNWCRIAGDGQGNYLATWQQPPPGSSYGDIWVNRYVAGSGWQTPQTIESDQYWSYNPVVAMAYDPVEGVSKAVVAWENGDNVKVNRLTNFAANTWSGAELAENRQVGLVTASQVGMAAIWGAKFDRSTSTWSQAAKLEEAPWDAIQPVVAMNSSGVATTVWVQPDNSLTHIYANRDTVAPAGAPYAPTGLSAASAASLSARLTDAALAAYVQYQHRSQPDDSEDKHPWAIPAVDLALLDLAYQSSGRRQPTEADHDLLLATYDPTMWL
jgi:subtilisin-like proprotein convertase family protein